MAEQKISATIMLPHPTPLSQLRVLHRQILGELAAALPDANIRPVQPCHCHVGIPRSGGIPDCGGAALLKELKQSVGNCTVLPPEYRNGFLFQPVELAGVQVLPPPTALLHKILSVPAVPPTETTCPGGFVFGRIFGNRTLEDRVNEILKKTETDPLRLRVFRLLQVEYRWEEDGIPAPLFWTAGTPQWVKLS